MKVIIISGPTGSGKTTLSKQILNKFPNGIELSTDNYYKSGLMSKVLSRIVDCYFDRKISFNYNLFKKDFKDICMNSKSDHKYSYNFKTKKIKKIYKRIINIKYIIVEGIFTKNILRNFKKHNTLFIELGTNKESCMNRVINRDIEQRGKSRNLAEKNFLKSWKIYYDKNNHSDAFLNKFLYSQNTNIYNEIKNKLNLKTYI